MIQKNQITYLLLLLSEGNARFILGDNDRAYQDRNIAKEPDNKETKET